MKKNILLIFTLLFFIIVTFFNIEITVNVVKESLYNFKNFLLPYIFPFLVLTTLFIKLKGGILIAYIFQKLSTKLFKIDGYKISIILLSILCGYPSNSIIIEDYYNKQKINKNDAIKLIYYSSFPSLFFLFGSLRNFIKDDDIIKLIFLSIFSSGFLILKNLNLSVLNIDLSSLKEEISYDLSYVFSSLKESILKGISTSLIILSTYVFFSIISNNIYLINSSLLSNILCSLLEFSNGVFSLAKLNVLDILKYNLIVFVLCIGGLSILIQIDASLTYLKFNYFYYFKAKLKHAFLACLIFNILYIFFII